MYDALPTEVYLREVGPRDGLQNEPGFVPTEVKGAFIEALAASGVPHIEITSFVHPKWIPPLADGQQIGARYADLPGRQTSALAPNVRGFEDAQKAGMQEISVFMSASESHNKANINRSIAETVANLAELIPTAKQAGMRVNAGVSVICGCPFEGVVSPKKVLELAEQLKKAGADRVLLGDTIGIGTPRQIRDLMRDALPLLGADGLILHLHDTQGMAVANAVTALEEGVRIFDGAVGGLGGCPYAPGASGNVPTEALVYAFEGMGVRTGIDLEKLLKVGEWIEDQLGRPLPSQPLKAYQGRKKRDVRKKAQAAARGSASNGAG